MKNQIAYLSDYLDMNESVCVTEMLGHLSWDSARRNRAHEQAVAFVEQVRGKVRPAGELEGFLQHYSLDTDEGLALMCLAEALLRIPDVATKNALIKDKITAANWGEKKKAADWVVKAAGLGLVVTRGTLESALERIGAPFIREAMVKAMRIMGTQFVLGEDIESAVENAVAFEADGYVMSYDMLGEGARTAEDAGRYFESYKHALETAPAGSGVSVKLSAFMNLTVDAEEVDRLVPSMEIIDAGMQGKGLKDWDGFGLAVQAYQKRAVHLIDFLEERSINYGRRLQVRLVKGAYWDSEIKRAQVMGLQDYPVYTRKSNTDLSYMLCAQKLLRSPRCFKPMFATHNAHSIAAVIDMAGSYHAEFELQRLHGMGEALFEGVMREHDVAASIYAPVGPHSDLLAYLVRRLLENGANTSFVNQVMDESVPAEVLVRDPVIKARENRVKRHPQVPYPADLYADEVPVARVNSVGLDLSDGVRFEAFDKALRKALPRGVPEFEDSSEARIDAAFLGAQRAQQKWNDLGGDARGVILERIGDLFEDHMVELMAVLVSEAKKTVEDALGEVREAVDFCRYYAAQGRVGFDLEGQVLPGPTGEENRLLMQGRGVFVCIAPWNFPLAIFTGQIVAALMAGNGVVAKPAEQTPYIAKLAVDLMHKAGVPEDVLHLVFGAGDVGALVVAHDLCGGVAFTGSSEVARVINRALAAKEGAIVPLIAETGGMNAMIVDASALPEQVVDDVIVSAFGSAGQRCSALRILCVQDDIADRVIEMLRGAMAELRVGDGADISSDLGAVIDDEALEILRVHRERMEQDGTLIAEVSLNDGDDGLEGTYFAPCAFEIENLDGLEREVFGPILHVVRFARKGLGDLVEMINGKGYGLTFGVHSRIEDFQREVAQKVQAGNIYVNRSMIGAVVGSQPFGGMGLSGTGPKAGGPHYLYAFATEKVVSIDTTAAGGNAALVSSIE